LVLTKPQAFIFFENILVEPLWRFRLEDSPKAGEFARFFKFKNTETRHIGFSTAKITKTACKNRHMMIRRTKGNVS
jgi:hypothetical protein